MSYYARSAVQLAALLMTVSMVILPLPVARGDGELGIISGRVFDSVSLLPLSGAMVVLDGNGTMWMTGHNGDYAIPDVPFGIHRVRAFIEGYLAKSHEVNLSGPSATLDIYLDPATEPVSGALTGVLRLERTYGELDADDASVVVRAIDGPENYELVLDVMGSGLYGEFSSTLPPGNWSVQGMAFGHVPSAPAVVLLLPGNVVHQDILLMSTDALVTLLEGTVLDTTSGKPIEGATVAARCVEAGITYICPTGPTGHYFFTEVPKGDYIVAAMAPGHLPVSASVDVTDGSPTVLDLELVQLDTLHNDSSVIWGLITVDGRPSRDTWAYCSGGGHMRADALGIDGLYVFHEVREGMKVIGGWAPDRFLSTVALDVPASAVMRQDLALSAMSNTTQGNSMVLFRVNDGSSEHRPLGGASVTLYKTDRSTGLVERYHTLQMPSDGSAAAMFPVPSDSNYRVRAVLNGHALKNLTVEGRTEVLAPDDAFLVLGNRLNVVELRMLSTGEGGDRNCTLWGFAAADMLGGRPVQGAAIYLNRGHDILSYTDMAGMYEFQLPSGEVDLLAAFPGSYGHSAYDHSSGGWHIGDFTGTMAPGETRRVDLVFQKRNTEDSSVAGRVVELSSGAGVSGFHISMRTSQSVMPEQVTGPGGLFHFTPLRDLVRPWRVSGGLPGFNIVRVDRREVPDGPTTTGMDFPFDIPLKASTLTWVDIYVERTSDENLSKAVLWGQVTLSSSTGAPLQGALLTASSSLFEQTITDEDGMFTIKVSPGTYRLTVHYPGMTSSFAHDQLADSWVLGGWFGTLKAAEAHRVDMVVNPGKEGASSVAGRVLMASGGTPVDGFRLKMRTLTMELPPQVTVGGSFSFSPLEELNDAWTLSGDSPDHTVSRIEHMVLPSASPTVQASLPLSYQVPQGSILWVDVYVNSSSSVKDARISGQVMSPYTYVPLEGVTVLVSSGTDRTRILRTTMTGDDGAFELQMAAGDYVLRLTKEGHTEISFELELGNAQEVFQRFFMVPDTAKEGRSTLFTFLDSVKGTPVKELKVQIGGLGVFVTDGEGQVMVDVPFSGNYTFTVTGSVENITSVSGTNVTIGPGGTIHLVPGDEYILRMRPYVQKVSDKEKGMSEPLLVGLIVGILVALFVGLIIGLLIARRPKEMAFFEE